MESMGGRYHKNIVVNANYANSLRENIEYYQNATIGVGSTDLVGGIQEIFPGKVMFEYFI